MTCSRRFLVRMGLSLILVLTPLTAASSSPTTTRAGRIGRGMEDLVAAGARGVIVLVRDGDQVIRLARGFADVARKAPMRTTDRFRIASLSPLY